MFQPPLVFEEACTEVKRILTVEMRVFVDLKALMTGDGYGPGCSGNGPCYKAVTVDGVKEVEKKEVAKPVHKKKSMYEEAGHAEFKRKEAMTCRDYNTKESGCNKDPCKWKHACSKKVRFLLMMIIGTYDNVMCCRSDKGGSAGRRTITSGRVPRRGAPSRGARRGWRRRSMSRPRSHHFRTSNFSSFLSKQCNLLI
jgi:hypothetical protein